MGHIFDIQVILYVIYALTYVKYRIKLYFHDLYLFFIAFITKHYEGLEEENSRVGVGIIFEVSNKKWLSN